MFIFNADEELEEGNAFKTYHEFDEDEIWQVVICWYLSIFVFGFLGINELRILLISLIAPS